MELSNEAIWKSLKVAGFNQGLARMDNGGIGMEMPAVSFYFSLIALSRLIETGALKLTLVDGAYPTDVHKALTTLNKMAPMVIENFEQYTEVFYMLEFKSGDIQSDEPQGDIATIGEI